MRNLKLILILMLVIVINTCSQAQQMPKSAYKSSAKIELKLKHPDYERVLKLLEEAKTYYPDDGEIWFLLGKVYSIKHRPKDMLAAFDQALKLTLKDNERKEIKEIISQTWISTFNQGVNYANKVKDVERFAANSFSDWSSYSMYADSLQQHSSEFESSNYNWKGYASAQEIAIPVEKLKEELYTKSLEQYEAAMFLDSTRYEAFVNGAYVSSKIGKPEKALEYFKKAYALKPDDNNVLTNYLAVLLSNKQYDEALIISEKILKENPDDLNVLFNQAVLLETMGRKEEAMSLYNKIVELDPNSKDVYFNRALLYLEETNRIAKNLIALRDSLEKNPQAKDLVERSHKLIEEQKNFFGKAEADFRKSIELNPADYESMRFLGYCYLNQEKIDGAIEVLEALTQKEPDNREAWGYLSIAYTKKGMVEKAKDAERKAQEP
ncbi:MAG: tetratricopeptide repeat protein [candidate division Zixibacteria bacterium]|nr:tetratricopeptide repeat protein [candidate division Zixibacteria bacterium]